MKQQTNLLPPKLREVRDVFDFSASDNVIAPSFPILEPASSENEIKERGY
jgi:hypothetical protein